eukprot:TRINITY_DN85534_c0_g1_i1.p1 TRINITY_DN85534_c0_g1~~TRINITY_DN85534_c0_g1_i1.p1  ORF type:complete len:257 (+),score=23.20 TRINITY_DN85534_c0_g1_i1:27-797(+)
MSCKNEGCTFFGAEANEGYCSSCYKNILEERGVDIEALEEEKKKKAQQQREFQSQLNSYASKCMLEKFQQLLREDEKGWATPFVLREAAKAAARAASTAIIKFIVEEKVLDMSISWLTDVLEVTRCAGLRTPTEGEMEFINYLLTFPEIREKLEYEHLELAVYTTGGKDLVKLLIDVGTVPVTQKLVTSARYSCKRPANVPTPEKREIIAVVEQAFKERNKAMAAARAAKRAEESSPEPEEPPPKRQTRSQTKKKK